MIDGYMSFLCLWLTLVLLWMGSLDNFLSKIGIGKKMFIIWLVGTAIFMFFSVEVAPFLTVNIGGFLLPLFFTVWLWNRSGDLHFVHLFSVSCLLSSTLFLMKKLFFLDPVLMVIPELDFLLITTVLLTIIAVKTAAQTLFVITFGLIGSDLLYQISSFDSVGMIILGSTNFRDLWWTSIFLCLCIRGVLEWSFRNRPFIKKNSEILK